jgi:NADH-quinone oxidoreductase subunit D
MTNPQSAIRNSKSAGPYSPELPWPMRLRLDLRSASDMLITSVEIESAEAEYGYNHIGLEERVADGGLDWTSALSVVETLCAPCSQANALCFAQAVEGMSHLLVPPRAAYLRLVLAEMERIISHLENAADTMEALGLPEREAALRDVRERVVNALSEWAGARQQPRLITFGGLSRNMDEAASRSLTLAMRHVERVLRAHVVSIINNKGIVDRLVGLGVIKGKEALAAGLRGPVARASGVAMDLRASFTTGAYEDEAVTVIVQRNGDAFSRLVVRLLECLESFRVVEQALDDLPGGPVKTRSEPSLRAGRGISRVEGPRGEVFCWVDGAPEGLRGLHLSAGSFPALSILPGLLAGARLEDLRLLLLSLDLCLPCAER